MTELPKTFDPAAIESRWYSHWEAGGLFRPDRPGAEPFTIVIPPPNVTGSLHIGHALDNTLQDILVRHARLKGKDALWVVGTDHAGIATQMVVERQMNARGEKRTDLTREGFIEKVWDWKAESGGTITGQLRRLGASCDWSNERFTMDEGFSKAVVHVFVKLYEQGLLYRDKRLVNWDPGLKTAISDLEVETREIAGKFWHLRYPLADGSGHIMVATTRPETMLADMAVAVNASDERYTALIGKQVRLPITGRLIPIVADDHADPELGSGAVKITPGHDFNDFEVGRRAGILASEMLNMLDAEAKVVQTADGLIPADYLGLDRFDVRQLIVARLKAEGVLVPHIDKDGAEHDAEPRTIQTPFGDRSGAVIEPWLTDQWYVDAKTLAQPAIDAVRDGRIKVVPETWAKTWFNWLENIQPWCVSRQLWWGHRIPAWYDEDGNVFVAEDEAKAKDLAGPRRALTRDEDVLDTWFSSALWPFGTLGWPDVDPRELGRYPNDVLISGFDILFFWDARMAMQGMHFLQDVPFKTLYLHGLVRDATGAKMSKSKGNTVDPLGLIDQYGADALRFTLAAMESQGRDIKLNESRVEGYRNFATKLWNAARFLQSNGVGPSTALEAPAAQAPVNRWIIAETVATVQALDLALADLRFDEAANTIYQFVWTRFCDWYIELTKGSMDEETKLVAGWAFDQILVMLHPFMPFITEELWHSGGRDSDIITARWPMADARALDPEAAKEIAWVIDVVSEIRSNRNELGIPPGTRMECYVAGADAPTQLMVKRLWPLVSKLARVELVDLPGGELGKNNTLQVIAGGLTFALQLEGVIDIEAERARLAKGKAAAEKERDGLAGRLSNPSFVERAKPEAVEKARADHADKAAEAERLGAALARLG
ncbi:valine--tRNA ligase [Sphingomonas abietis]|uniref:Valine--tRNA ligase n=1 Tax=Sphingomonas abietis TaxID=3012344 RepID=A0ABY7NRP5_9SPHN|nr:valine--tRNA ligase [Sphingomonas abietis]WBO24207.1 valine--tRNA ligase [Sphingomonas abietis]